MATFDGVPLITALKWGKDLKAKGWIQTIIAGTSMLEYSPQKRFAGRVFEQDLEGTLPNVQFRSINEGYEASHGENEPTWWGTSVLGGEIRVDIAVLADGTVEDAAAFRAEQYAKHAKSASMRYSWEFFNGTGANKGFRGLSSLIGEGFGVLHTPTVADVVLDFDELDRALIQMENGDATAMYCNKEIALQFTQVARGGNNGFTLVSTGNDVLGRRIMLYNGIPVRIIRRGRTATGQNVQILPFTETGDTSSLYIVRHADDAVCGLLGKNGSMHMRNLRESTEGPYEVGRLEFYPGCASFDPVGVVRYERIHATATA